MAHRRADAGRSSRRLRRSGVELDAQIMHADPEAAMREIRRLRAAQEEVRRIQGAYRALAACAVSRRRP